jgi:glycine betaine/proline transport system permease protein
MFDFPEILSFPLLAEWINLAVKWLTINWAPFFDIITIGIREPLVQLEHGLWWLPWWAVIIILAGVAWRFAGRRIAVIALVGMFFIGVMGLWDQTMTTMAIIITSVAVSLLIGIPLGIVAAKSDRFEAIMRPLLDGMQTMPSFVYLIPAVFFFGLGKVPAVVATFIYAVPPCIRLTNPRNWLRLARPSAVPAYSFCLRYSSHWLDPASWRVSTRPS